MFGFFRGARRSGASEDIRTYLSPRLPLGTLVCGAERSDFREDQRFNEVRMWAEARGIAFVTLKPADFGSYAWPQGSALWIPFLQVGDDDGPNMDQFDALRGVPTSVPLIIDTKSASNHSYLQKLRELALPHRKATRHVRPCDTGDLFELKVQYNHLPVPLPEVEAQDIVLFDVHPWEPLGVHTQVLDLMNSFGVFYESACRRTKQRLKFFLTSFTPFSMYAEMAELLHARDFGRGNQLDVIRENLIPPAATREDFLRIIARTRFAVTFHNNLSDMVVSELVANEIPTLVLGSSVVRPFPPRIESPDRSEVPGIDAWLGEVEARLVPRLTLKMPELAQPHDAPLGNRQVMTNIFNHCWDRLWAWAHNA